MPAHPAVVGALAPKMIKEGRESFGQAKLANTDADKVRTLLNEADKAHDGGDYAESMKKPKESLSLPESLTVCYFCLSSLFLALRICVAFFFGLHWDSVFALISFPRVLTFPHTF